MALLQVEKHYDDPLKFIEDLSPFASYWHATGGLADPNLVGDVNWIFRGQRDAAWKLQPAAMRPRTLTHYGIGIAGTYDCKSLSEQLAAETSVVTTFIGQCMRAALPLPEDSQWSRNELLDAAFDHTSSRVDRGAHFPNPLKRSVFALAQHHRIPTRLLDWSQEPLVAAYFACRDVAERRARKESPPDSQRDRLVVWALRQLAWSYPSDLADDTGWFEPTIELVTAPYAENPNLRAQKGLFTLVRYLTPRSENDFRLPTIEDVITKYELAKYKEIRNDHENGPWLIKMTLPHRHAGRLLRLLNQANINAATIYPSYDAVTMALTERTFYE